MQILPKLHENWVSQLANGGRLVCIIQNGPVGRVTVFTKSGNAIGETVAFDTSAPYLQGFEPEAEFVDLSKVVFRVYCAGVS